MQNSSEKKKVTTSQLGFRSRQSQDNEDWHEEQISYKRQKRDGHHGSQHESISNSANGSSIQAGNSQEYKSAFSQKSKRISSGQQQQLPFSAKSRRSEQERKISHPSVCIDLDDDLPDQKQVTSQHKKPATLPNSQNERKVSQPTAVNNIDLATLEIPVDSQAKPKQLVSSQASNNEQHRKSSQSVVQKHFSKTPIVQQSKYTPTALGINSVSAISHKESKLNLNNNVDGMQQLLEMPVPQSNKIQTPPAPQIAQQIQQTPNQTPTQNKISAQPNVVNHSIQPQYSESKNPNQKKPTPLYQHIKPQNVPYHQAFDQIQANKNQFIDQEALQERIISIAAKKGLENLTKTSCHEVSYGIMSIMQGIVTQLIQTSREQRAMASVCNPRTFSEAQIKRVTAQVFVEDLSLVNEQYQQIDQQNSNELPVLEVEHHTIDLICLQNTTQEIKAICQYEQEAIEMQQQQMGSGHDNNNQNNFQSVSNYTSTNQTAAAAQQDNSAHNQWQVQQTETMQALLGGYKKHRKAHKKGLQKNDVGLINKNNESCLSNKQEDNHESESLMETAFGGFQCYAPEQQTQLTNVPITAMRTRDIYMDREDASLQWMYNRRITTKDLQAWARRGASTRTAQSLSSGCQSARLSHKLNQILSLSFL